MVNKLLSFCAGASLALSFAWLGGCGDPNPRGVIYAGGSGGSAPASGGSGGTTPGGTGGAIGTGGTVGSGGAQMGSGGQSAGSGGAHAGGAPGSGGAAAGGTAGAASGGTGLSSGGAPGAGGGTGGRGGAGAGGPGGAPVGVSVIDSLDDGDGMIAVMAGRQGPWHSFNDSNNGNQTPSINGPFVPEMGGVNGSPYAAHTKGSGYQFAGIGFDLNNATTMPGAMQSQAYDASAYKGIIFWAKGNGNLRVELSQKAFVPTANGGSCTASCWNVYGSRAAQGMLSLTEWRQVAIPFGTLTRDDGSTTPSFDPSQLMGIAFKHEGSTFDFWIDDVEFF